MRERPYESLLARITGEPSELTEEDQASRGHEAARILESQVFQDAYADAELTLLQEWKNNEDASPVTRERCHAAIRSLDVIWLALSRIVTNGVVAEERIRVAREG